MAKPAGEQKSNTMFGNARKSTIFIALGTMLLLDLAIGLSLGYYLHSNPSRPAEAEAATQTATPLPQPATQDQAKAEADADAAPAVVQPVAPAPASPEAHTPAGEPVKRPQPSPTQATQTTQPTPTRSTSTVFADAGRSAIAQPGETFTTPIAPRTLSPEGQHSKPDAPTKAAPAESIPWHHAPQYLGQTVTVEGKIIDTHNTGKVCFLNFSPNKQHDFYIIIFDQVFDQLPAPPEQLYLHKTIQVRGQVRTFRNRQQIQVRSAKQITIVE